MHKRIVGLKMLLCSPQGVQNMEAKKESNIDF